MIGRSLGHYEILAGLGAGGMGDVYRCRDTRLGRDVAIKLLPDEFAADAERLARFEREARVLAALNHPHIAQIHGLEEDEGRRFLVLELVEGESLAERIARGPISVENTLPIALQIARALQAAHERGIVHRDVKPANVMLTPEGDAKVLDFGIAKPLERPPREGHTRTLTGPRTRPGVAMGTPAYMSPEQLRGEGADRRTDIWAFGVTLWEMLTGMRLFAGATDSDTVAAVLRAEPNWHVLPADTPQAIIRLLRHCLERDSRRRLHDIADARLEIEESLAAPGDAGHREIERTGAPARTTRWWQLSLCAALGAVLALAAAWMLSGHGVRAPERPTRTALALPPGVTMRAFARPVLAISPDGQSLVFEAKEGGTSRLFKRFLDQFDAVPIPGTEGAEHPFFSPDARWVGFFADGTLKKVSLSGGPPQVLTDASNPWGGTWAPSGKIVFCPSDWKGLWRVPDVGGTAELIVRPDPGRGELDLVWPELLPDGSAVLFTNWWGLAADDAHVGVLDLESHSRTTLIEHAYHARYVPTGHLVFGQNGSVYVAPFNAERRELTGPSVPLPESIFVESEVGVLHMVFSATGTLAFVPGGGGAKRRLVSVDLAGNEAPLIDARRAYTYPRVSPDGERLAVAISEAGETQIWIINLATGAQTKVTQEFTNTFPMWAPDGERVAYVSVREEGVASLAWTRADGTGESEVLVQEEEGVALAPGSWSPDGEMLVYSKNTTSAAEEHCGIWAASRDRERQPRLLFSVGANTAGAAVSPNGRWLAYMSGESGRSEIYVQPFPDGGERHQVSTGGGIKPVWSPDGRVIYYRSKTKDQTWAVPVSTTPRFRAGTAKLLLEGLYAEGIWEIFPNFDVTADGTSFVVVKPDEEWGRTTEIRIVLNWFHELERLAPPDRTP